MSTIKANQWLNPDGTENYKCRAWVHLNASSGIPTIVAAGNVSSITDNAAGDFTVNFTTAMSDALYSVAGSSDGLISGTTTLPLIRDRATAPTTTATRCMTKTGNAAGGTDCTYVSVVVFR